MLAAALSALVWPVFAQREEQVTASGATATTPQKAAPRGGPEMALLAVAYGFAGFGYIITATFLPVIARQALPGSPWLDMFWPIFGVGVIAGSLLATSRSASAATCATCWLPATACRRGRGGQQPCSPTLAGFAVGSVLLGLPFTTITFFAMQEVRRLRPGSVHSFMGLLTAMYGTGADRGPAAGGGPDRPQPDSGARLHVVAADRGRRPGGRRTDVPGTGPPLSDVSRAGGHPAGRAWRKAGYGLTGSPFHHWRCGPRRNTAKCRCGASVEALPVLPT